MTVDTLDHEDFCLPRPGEDEVRRETYTLPVYDDNDHVTRYVHVERCQECGVIAYDGVQRS